MAISVEWVSTQPAGTTFSGDWATTVDYEHKNHVGESNYTHWYTRSRFRVSLMEGTRKIVVQAQARGHTARDMLYDQSGTTYAGVVINDVVYGGPGGTEKCTQDGWEVIGNTGYAIISGANHKTVIEGRSSDGNKRISLQNPLTGADIKIRVGGAWADADAVYVNANGSMAEADGVFVYTDGAWEEA